jgi:hypothetical protein
MQSACTAQRCALAISQPAVVVPAELCIAAESLHSAEPAQPSVLRSAALLQDPCGSVGSQLAEILVH